MKVSNMGDGKVCLTHQRVRSVTAAPPIWLRGGRYGLVARISWALLLVFILIGGREVYCSSSDNDVYSEPAAIDEMVAAGEGMGAAIEYSSGVNPALACTADGWVVEVHEAAFRDRIWFNVGKFDDNNSFQWLGQPAALGSGVEPGVAMTDDGVIIVVHRARNGNGLWYEVGQLNKKDGSVSWLRGPSEYESGSYPGIIIFNDYWVVETHQSTIGSQEWYKVGKLDKNNYTIDFGGSIEFSGFRIAAFKDTDKLIQISSGGYRFGSVDKDSRVISWRHPKKQPSFHVDGRRLAPNNVKRMEPARLSFENVASCAYLCKTNSGETTHCVAFVAEVEWPNALHIFRAFVTDLGDDPWLYITVDEAEMSPGKDPAFADANGRAIEMHQSRFPEKTLWYSIGMF